MSKNKNALIRYHALDACFRNSGRNYSLEDLLESVNHALLEQNPTGNGIKKRQLFEDIKFMESEQGWEIPLQRMKEGKTVFYRYSSFDFSIKNQPLNEWEAEKIKSALLLLSRFKGMPQFDWVDEILMQLQQSFRLENKSQEVISFDANEYLKNIHLFGEFYSAIVYQKVLEIEYQAFKNSESKKFEFHPYYLKQYNNRWFIIGLYPKYENYTHFALDRIVSIKEIASNYISTNTDFETYFEDVIGVSKPKNSEVSKVILRVIPALKPYIITKPLHGSQKKFKENESGFYFSLELFINFELENLILSYGETMEVIEPESLRLKIKDRIEKNRELYK